MLLNNCDKLGFVFNFDKLRFASILQTDLLDMYVTPINQIRSHGSHFCSKEYAHRNGRMLGNKCEVSDVRVNISIDKQMN